MPRTGSSDTSKNSMSIGGNKRDIGKRHRQKNGSEGAHRLPRTTETKSKSFAQGWYMVTGKDDCKGAPVYIANHKGETVVTLAKLGDIVYSGTRSQDSNVWRQLSFLKWSETWLGQTCGAAWQGVESVRALFHDGTDEPEVKWQLRALPQVLSGSHSPYVEESATPVTLSEYVICLEQAGYVHEALTLDAVLSKLLGGDNMLTQITGANWWLHRGTGSASRPQTDWTPRYEGGNLDERQSTAQSLAGLDFEGAALAASYLSDWALPTSPSS